jgi:hypothetical protein
MTSNEIRNDDKSTLYLIIKQKFNKNKFNNALANKRN